MHGAAPLGLFNTGVTSIWKLPQSLSAGNRRICGTKHNPQGPLNTPIRSILKGHMHGWAVVLYIRAAALKCDDFCSLEL